MKSKFVQFPYEFRPPPGSLPARPAVDVKRLEELVQKTPALELFAFDICVEKVGWSCEIVIDARWMPPSAREAHTVAVRIPYQNYFFVRVPNHWTTGDLKNFKKHILGTPEKPYRQRVELVSGQNLCAHLDFGTFAKIYHNGTSTSMRLADQFRLPRDVSHCKHLLNLGIDEQCNQYMFTVFEANVPPDKRFMLDSSISGGSWFAVAEKSYFVVGDRPTEESPVVRLTKRQVELKIKLDHTAYKPIARDTIVPLRTLSFDGEMLSKALKFPIGSNQDDGTIYLGNVLDLGVPDAPLETAVFTIAHCRTDEAEARERRKPLSDLTRCPIYRYEAWPLDHKHNNDESLESWRQLLTKKEPATDWHNMQANIRAMLLGWQAFVEHVDPDVRINYNGDGFDWPFLFDDAVKLGLLEKGEHVLWGPTHVVPAAVKTLANGQPCFGEFSMFHNEVATCRKSFTKSAAKGAQVSFHVTGRGHLEIDILKDVRDTYSLPSNTLNAVAEHFLGQRKLDVSIHSMMRACLDGFENPTDERLMQANEDTALYCGKDALLPMLLMHRFLQTVVKLFEFARATGLNVRTIWQNGQQQRAFQGILMEGQPTEKHPVRMMIPTKMPHKNDDRHVDIVQAANEAADEAISDGMLGLVDSQDRVEVQMRGNHQPSQGEHEAEENEEEDEEENEEEEDTEMKDAEAKADEPRALIWDFHWDVDEVKDREQLGLLLGPRGTFGHIGDPVARIIEEARERARLRQEKQLAKPGESREFRTVQQPNESLQMYLARSQQLQALVEPAQRRVKVDKKEASKQETKARHAKGYQGAIQLEPEKGLHIEDPWTHSGADWAKAQAEQCRNDASAAGDEAKAKTKLQHAAWWQTTAELLSSKESATAALDKQSQQCIANAGDLFEELRLPVPVKTLDHAAMYPHIIIQFNLSYETLLTQEDIKKHGYTPRVWPAPVWDETKQQFVRPPITGDYWVIPGAGGVTHMFLARPEDTPRGIQGLLPRLLLRLLEERKKAKKELAKWTHAVKVLTWKLKFADKNAVDARDEKKWAITRQEATQAKAEAQLQAMSEFENEVLRAGIKGSKLEQLKTQWQQQLRHAQEQVTLYDKKQGAFKILANSIYGFTGVPEAIAMLGCPAIAEAVTYWGRLFIEEDKMMAETLFDGSDPESRPLGRVIYGDTDSIMLRVQFILDRRIRYWRLRLALKEAERRAPTLVTPNFVKWLRYVVTQAIGPGETSRILERFLLGASETINNREQLSTEIKRLLVRWRKQLDEDMFAHSSKCGFRSVAAFNSAHILPTKLEFEKIYFPFVLFMRKKYAGMKFPAGNTLAEGKREEKGIATVRRDFCDLVNETMGAGLDQVFIHRNLDAAIELFRDAARKLLAYETEMHLITLSKKLSSEYKNPKGFSHLTVVEKMKRRLPGSEPPVGARVPYYIREPPSGCWVGAPVKVKSRGKTAKKWKTSELGEDIMYGIEHGIPYNAEYYLSKQLSNPIAQFMAFIWYPELIPEGDTRSDTYKKAMAKLIKRVGHELFGAIPRTVRNYVCPEEQHAGIRRFAVPLRRCLGCPSTLEPHIQGVLCTQCQPRVIDLAVSATDRAATAHDHQVVCWLECYRCPATGGSYTKAQLCENVGCPNFARKRVAAAKHRVAGLHAAQLQEELLREEPEQQVRVTEPALKRARIDVRLELPPQEPKLATRPTKRAKLRQTTLSF